MRTLITALTLSSVLFSGAAFASGNYHITVYNKSTSDTYSVFKNTTTKLGDVQHGQGLAIVAEPSDRLDVINTAGVHCANNVLIEPTSLSCYSSGVISTACHCNWDV